MQNHSPLPRTRTLAIAAVLLLAALLLGLWSVFGRTDNGQPGSGTALVGGSFTMADQDGRTVTEKTFAGKYMLVFFGYTFCPDVCPTTLQVISKALDKLGPAADRLVPVFVSVDPERDDVATVKAYVEAIDARLTGLRGTPQQLAAMASAFRVFYAKRADTQRPADYLMDHSSIVYLMGPDGKFLKHFNYDVTSDQMAAELARILQ